MNEVLKKTIKDAVSALGLLEVDFVVEHPAELEHGDYATNVAMVLSKQVEENPRDLAERIAEKFDELKPKEIIKVEVAGPGFINFSLDRSFFSSSIKNILEKGGAFGTSDTEVGKRFMVEYTDPNCFKVFHIGHLMSNSIGESLARLAETRGAIVRRVNYPSDVGLNIAKAIWGIQELIGEMPTEDKTLTQKTAFLGKAYVHGNTAYEEDEEAKKEIDELNGKIYDQSDENINNIYRWGRKVSLDHFEELYKKLGTSFDHYFFESEVAYDGKTIVEAFLEKGVFEKSDGAVIFPGEKYGLHNRVFITSKGIPTYEAKEIGLNTRKFNLDAEPDPDLSVIVTASEQDDYFKVVLKALEQIEPKIAERTEHISHGMMRFAEGKMSSRKGNVITGESLIEDMEKMVSEKVAERDIPEEEKGAIIEAVAIGAIKYSILKQAVGRDIVFDPEKSVSFEGDSGPYVQYTHARTASVLRKAEAEGIGEGFEEVPKDISKLEKMLYRYPEVVERAYQENEPHHVVTFLTEIASEFNTYYSEVPIVSKDDTYSPFKVAITKAVKNVLRNGLWVLGVEAPRRM